jgi:hypothetical protein
VFKVVIHVCDLGNIRYLIGHVPRNLHLAWGGGGVGSRFVKREKRRRGGLLCVCRDQEERRRKGGVDF